MTRYYSPRVTDTDAAWRLLQALIAHPEGAATYQLIRWTGLERGQLEKGKRRLRQLDDQGIFICIPKGADTIYILSEDADQSRLYEIWMHRRIFRQQQSALNTRFQTAKTAARTGTIVWGEHYASEASAIESLASEKSLLRRMGAEAGFTPKEIEAWFAEGGRWELDERTPA